MKLIKRKKYIKTINKKKFKYDHLILANHTDQIKKILKQTKKEQLELLNSVKYQKNKVIVHTDKNLMPKKKG